MAISYPLSMPTGEYAAAAKLKAQNVVGLSRSPFTGVQQTFTYPGQWWEADITLPPLKGDSADEWVTFLLSLQGRTGTFLLGEPGRATAKGSASSTPGTPVVDGAGQTGNDLAVRGLPLSATGYLKAGDYIQLGSGTTAQLHKVLAQVDSDGSGDATMTLFPRIRTSPGDGNTIVVDDAKGLFRLGANQTEWDLSPADLPRHQITFSAVEALPFG